MPLDSRLGDSPSNNSRRQSPLPKRAYSLVDNQGLVDNSPGHPAHQETLQLPQDSSLAFEPLSFHAVNASSSHTLDGTPQGPTPNELGQPGPTVSPTAIDNPVDMPSTSSPSLPASPATPSISDSSTRLSAIQIVQSYLAHQAQEIQSHLTAVLPDIIQREVRTQCAQLIGNQISSIQEELIRPIGDQDCYKAHMRKCAERYCKVV